MIAACGRSLSKLVASSRPGFCSIQAALRASNRAHSKAERRLPQSLNPANIKVVPLQALPIDIQGFLSSAAEPHPGLLVGAALNSVVYTLGYPILRKGLLPSGVLASWFLGTAVVSAFGVGGYILVCLYFVAGTAVTKLKLAQKQAEGVAEARSGQRGPGSVLGSGIAGLACALIALKTGDYTLLQTGFVASFCSKLSDTVSSEVGKAYGETTYLITTLKLVPRGTEGAVSLEGSLAGVAAAATFSGMALAVGQVDVQGAATVTVAAVIANVAESYVGATLQGKIEWITNDVVNMAQITLAAALAIAIHASYIST